MKTETTALIIMLGLFVGLIFCKIWLSVSISDLAYEYDKIENQLRKEQDLNLKLKAERSFLLSPDHLKDLAQKYGLRPAKENEIKVILP
ncbi:MAG: hypothetical protein Q9M37_09950 [Desulfonauticus sp.]|nr:hypothetical protein [Desulfonauticus sp.]